MRCNAWLGGQITGRLYDELDIEQYAEFVDSRPITSEIFGLETMFCQCRARFLLEPT